MQKLISILVISLACLLTSCSKEDERCPALVDGTWTYVELDSKAEPIDPGLDDTFSQLTINYPAEAREQSIEGTVILKYTITDTGTIENYEINYDIGGGCGEAARLAFEAFEGQQLYFPAIYQGIPVETYDFIPIKFKLE